jgi:hypothetical protein
MIAMGSAVFYERNDENRYSPYRMATGTWKCVAVETDHYDLNLEFLYLEEL